jgi:hypothetical protein
MSQKAPEKRLLDASFVIKSVIRGVRTGQSVESIKSFQFAVSQLGGSVEDATGAVQALIAAREKFGSANFSAMLRNTLGVDANSPRLFEDIAKAVANLDQAQARARLNWLGFNDATIQALRQYREFIDYSKEFSDTARKSGADLQSAAANAKKLEQAWRDLSNTVETILIKAFARFAGPSGVTKDLKDFNEWLQSHSDDIADALDRIAKDLLAVVQKAVDWGTQWAKNGPTWEQ